MKLTLAPQSRKAPEAIAMHKRTTGLSAERPLAKRLPPGKPFSHRLLFAGAGLLLFAHLAAAAEVIPLYSGPAPGSEDWDHQESQYYSDIFRTEVVTNVSHPTLTAFLPDPAIASGTAVIIAPGGGFHALSINSEGNDVARWLQQRGVAAFVLRYRLVPTGKDGVADMVAKTPEQTRSDMAAIAPLSGADGLAAMRLVRTRHSAFGISPDRIGFMGFSAGGAVATLVASRYDAATRPDFVAPIYAGIGMIGDTPVREDAPPLFIVAATDDQLDLARDSLTLYGKWLDAKRSAELHIYASGGHGFGMRRQDLPTDRWIDRFGDWLAAQGLMAVAQ
ncbi:MAG: alpha/beta hydrolase [Pseudomonadales bacterium]